MNLTLLPSGRLLLGNGSENIFIPCQHYSTCLFQLFPTEASKRSCSLDDISSMSLHENLQLLFFHSEILSTSLIMLKDEAALLPSGLASYLPFHAPCLLHQLSLLLACSNPLYLITRTHFNPCRTLHLNTAYTSTWKLHDRATPFSTISRT